MSSPNESYNIIDVTLPGGVTEKVPLFKLPKWDRPYTETQLRKPGMEEKIILREPSKAALTANAKTKCVISYIHNGTYTNQTKIDYDLTEYISAGYTVFMGNEEHPVNAANLQGGRHIRRRKHHSRRSRRHRSRRH
jgi:hypothetical protein